jgi:hypothetical protein
MDERRCHPPCVAKRFIQWSGLTDGAELVGSPKAVWVTFGYTAEQKAWRREMDLSM